MLFWFLKVNPNKVIKPIGQKQKENADNVLSI